MKECFLVKKRGIDMSFTLGMRAAGSLSDASSGFVMWRTMQVQLYHYYSGNNTVNKEDRCGGGGIVALQSRPRAIDASALTVKRFSALGCFITLNN